MNILVTGATGFIGTHLIAKLKDFQGDNLHIFSCTRATPASTLRAWCLDCDFVFHLAGVMRPRKGENFDGNVTVLEQVLSYLEQAANGCPVLLASSTQAALDNAYGTSKKLAEDMLIEHKEKTGAPSYIFRLPGVFGAGGRPHYNSVVATWCYNIAHHDSIIVNGRENQVTLAYIDDVVNEFIATLMGKPSACGEVFCQIPLCYTIALGYLADLIYGFEYNSAEISKRKPLDFEEKAYHTYLSYAALANPVK